MALRLMICRRLGPRFGWRDGARRGRRRSLGREPGAARPRDGRRGRLTWARSIQHV